MITVPRVDVTVVDTSGSPQVNQMVLWENTTGGTGGFVSTSANGHVVMAVPTGSYRFVATQNDFDFTSGAAGHCTVPSCTTATITTTIPITVTVRDTLNAPKPNLLVSWATTLGETGGWVNTNASGIAVLSVPAASMRFAVDFGGDTFYSGSAGHCTVPGCTTATITVSAPVLVTVVDTSGTPLSGKSVMWQRSSGATGGNTNTNASGQASIIPPLGVAVRFKVIVDGTEFYSSAAYDCTQPTCTSATILVSAPTVVTVVDGAGAPVSGRAVTPTSTEGITSGNKTTNTSGQATFRLPFAHWQFKAKCSGNNETFFSGNAGHCYIPGGCLTAKIKMPCGQCAGKPNGFACDDQTACSGSSTCQSQFCTGSNPMSCSASDQCHDAGACGAQTGTCSNPPKANGTSCNDNDACTGTSSCQAGVCTGGSPTTCTAQDQCHVAGTCNPATGVCSNPAKANGTSCSDGDSCTSEDSCQAGACMPGAQICGGPTLALAQTITSQYSYPRVTLTAPIDGTTITPGDHIAITATLNYYGLTVGVSGTLDTTNVTTNPVMFVEQEARFEYFSPSQSSWVVLARVAYDNSFTVLPGSTPETSYNASFREAPGPGVHTTTYTPASTTLDPDAIAKWSYGISAVLTSAQLAILADPLQSTAARAVLRFGTSGGGSDESSVDVTSAFRALVAPPFANLDATATLQSLNGSAFYGPTMTVGLTTSSPGPVAIDTTTVYTGELDVPFPDVLRSPYVSLGNMPLPYPRALWDELQQFDYFNSLETYASKFNAFHTQVQTPGGPLVAFSNFVYMSTSIPSVHSTPHAPADIISGSAVQYTVDVANSGTGAAGPISYTHLADSQSVAGSTTTVTPAELDASGTGSATVDFVAPFRSTSGRFDDWLLVNWSDRNGNVYGPVFVDPGSSLHVFPQGSLVVEQLVTQIVGDPASFSVTARDTLDVPAAGLPVHVAITGANPQAFDVVTGSDGVAHVSYTGTNIGNDVVVASGTVVTDTIQSAPQKVVWASAIGTPCAERATPLDIMVVIDTSPSMVAEFPNMSVSSGKLEAAQAAAHRFIDNLSVPRDQVGVVTFDAVAYTNQLSTNHLAAESFLDAGIANAIGCLNNFCGDGSDLARGLNAALDELDSPRHRSEATKVIVYIGDGGADVDPASAIARLRASGARTVAMGIGSNIDPVVRQIASSGNDYFTSPGAAAVDFAFNNLNQDLCRNLAPFVSAGGNQGFYNARIPTFLTVQGEVHDDGPNGDVRLTSEWTVISGPGPVSFADASSPVTDVLFGLPGTYVLQLAASDGYLTVADRATITVDPDPSIAGANLAVALTAAGPLETGQTETLTATLTDGLGAPIRDYVVRLTVAGANPVTTTLLTNSLGVATFTYQGSKPGTDVLHATAIGSTLQLDSAFLSVTWVQPASGGAFLTQGWIGSPLDQAKLTEQVPVVLSPDVTLASGTIKYYPAAAPTDVHFLATNVSGAPGATLATLDTTMLANGAYVIQLDGTDNVGNQKTSVVLVTVTGDYKPGRLVIELTDFTLPIAGLPITIGRRYDSLEKDKLGDFGYGWSLVIGHPRLEVNPNFSVSLTLPGGRRTTFGLTIVPFTEDIFDLPSFLGVYAPVYKGEPGVFGTLTQEGGCPFVRYNPANPADPIRCAIIAALIPSYAPEFYIYTDPYGTAYRMAASGELKSIKDRQGNTLSFEPNGIISSGGKSVTFERDAQGRITKVDYPAYFGEVSAAQYTYDGSGDLTTVQLPGVFNQFDRIMHHTYDQHRLLASTDPKGNIFRTSTYDSNGRLATDTDAMGNMFSYTYDLATRTNTTTYPDTGVVTQTFDARGLLLSDTDQLGRTTTREYDANRNEIARINALGERSTATYNTSGDQTSGTDSVGRTTSITYDEANMPVSLVDALGHTTSIAYDDRHLPSRIFDQIGTILSFTSSEQGVPVTVDDAVGNRAYLTYDVGGNVTSQTDWLGRVTRATYDQVGHRLSETTARGAVTTHNYALDGKRTSTTDVNGYQRLFGYDANGNLLAEYDAPSVHGSTNYTYNALNHLVQKTRALDGTTISYTRDFRGNPLTMTDEGGHTTSYEYDLVGNLRKTTFPDGDALPDNNPFTTRTYDVLNRLASVTDENGHITRYAYDLQGNVTTTTFAYGTTEETSTTTTYDADGRRSSVTDANNNTTSFAYDVRGHLIETNYPDGTSTHAVYNEQGRRTSTTNQTGATTLFGYDAQGQLTSVTDPLGNVTGYAYDLDGNLTSVTDANGHTTTYEYDPLNRKTKRTLPLGQLETFAYDFVGNLTAHMDFRGKTTTMTYDSRDRILTKVPDPSLGEATHAFSYWPNGLRHTATNASGLTTYGYDPRDRLITKETPDGTLTYTYDDTGNVKTISSNNENGTSVRYGWDAANHLVSITDYRIGQPGVGVTTTATYTPTGQPLVLTQPNTVAMSYSYDSLDRVTSMLWRQGTAPAFGSWTYTHNGLGQALTATDATGRNATYEYDSALRLTSETVAGDPRGATFNGGLSYLMDGVGNRLSRTSTLSAIPSATHSYNNNDELSSATYDANGNTISLGGHTYTYDFENRLVSKDGSTVALTYDCDGNRVAKTAGGVTTRYLVDDLNPTGYLQVLEEIVGGVVQTRYTYGTSLVSQTRGVGSSPTTSYYGYDAHGNVTFLTDSAGVVTDSYDYDAWGNVVVSTGATPNTRRYAAEELDGDLGLVNLRARYYAPTLGRFLSRDPLSGSLSSPLTQNAFLYGESDPVNRADPSGLAAAPIPTRGRAAFEYRLLLRVPKPSEAVVVRSVGPGAMAWVKTYSWYVAGPAAGLGAVVACRMGIWASLVPGAKTTGPCAMVEGPRARPSPPDSPPSSPPSCDSGPSDDPREGCAPAGPGGGGGGGEGCDDPIPQIARDVLYYISQTGEAPPGYQGGRTFRNDGRAGGEVLPRSGPNGEAITYREWDIHPYSPRVNRGAERIVTSSDGKAYYTGNHYGCFSEIL